MPCIPSALTALHVYVMPVNLLQGHACGDVCIIQPRQTAVSHAYVCYAKCVLSAYYLA